MSSPETDQPSQHGMFLPSMLRKNGGKFGATLGNALMNKFKPPGASQAESDDSGSNERPQNTNRHTMADVLNSSFPVKQLETQIIEKSTNNLPEQDNANTNTLDYVKRDKILSDVRSVRVKAPTTRPKSTHILKEKLSAAEIPLDDDKLTPVTTPSSEPEEKSSTSSAHIQIDPVQKKTQTVQKKTPTRTRTERPVSIGNIEFFGRVSPENSLVEKSTVYKEKVAQDKAKKKVLPKGLTHSKSTEILSSNCKPSKQPVTSEQTKTSETISNLKTMAVSLAKSVKSMEGEISNIKKQLSNLITLIGELQIDEK